MLAADFRAAYDSPSEHCPLNYPLAALGHGHVDRSFLCCFPSPGRKPFFEMLHVLSKVKEIPGGGTRGTDDSVNVTLTLSVYLDSHQRPFLEVRFQHYFLAC